MLRVPAPRHHRPGGPPRPAPPRRPRPVPRAAPPTERVIPVEWARPPARTASPPEERIAPPGEWHLPPRPGPAPGPGRRESGRREPGRREPGRGRLGAANGGPGTATSGGVPGRRPGPVTAPDTAARPPLPADPLRGGGYRRPSRTRLLAGVAAVAILGVTGVTGTLVVMHSHQTVAPAPAAASATASVPSSPGGTGTAGSASPAPAAARWSSPVPVDPQTLQASGAQITGLACPKQGVCYATDSAGSVLSLQSGGTWPVANTGPERPPHRRLLLLGQVLPHGRRRGVRHPVRPRGMGHPGPGRLGIRDADQRLVYRLILLRGR